MERSTLDMDHSKLERIRLMAGFIQLESYHLGNSIESKLANMTQLNSIDWNEVLVAVDKLRATHAALSEVINLLQKAGVVEGVQTCGELRENVAERG